ncbi:MAG: hypothetical protein WBV28_04900 [Terracidiphilus sp.]
MTLKMARNNGQASVTALLYAGRPSIDEGGFLRLAERVLLLARAARVVWDKAVCSGMKIFL